MDTHFFNVSLDLFEGPIDLLLHLVKQNELPIEKLSLAQVTQQYMECIRGVEDFDLEIAGEYLVIASTLLSIKSSILLQKPVEFVADEDGNMFDPHEELLRRLREAEVFKKSAEVFGGMKMLNLDVFPSPSSMRKLGNVPVKYAQHDPVLLTKAFQKLLAGLKDRDATYAVTLEPVSIVDRMMNVVEMLRSFEGGTVSFEKLIPDTSRGAIVVSFLALLELCKRHIIEVRQLEADEDIVVALVADLGDAPLSEEVLYSEFDQENQSAGEEAGEEIVNL